MAQSSPALPIPLPPHKYPAWIGIIGLLVVVSLAFSLEQLPPYYGAAVLMKRAEALSASGKDRQAIEVFTNALKKAPTSKRIRIGLAISYFRVPNDSDRKRGLDLLQGMTLQKDEWERLTAVMPAEYQRYFRTTKE